MLEAEAQRKNSNKKKAVKRQIDGDRIDGDRNEDKNQNTLVKSLKKLKRKVLSKTKSAKINIEDNENKSELNQMPEKDIFCPACNEQFVEPPDEDWIQCFQCKVWWHEACTYYSVGQFCCDFCYN
uniref:Uncharacterized protein LOC114332139 n=1 Tax=Diabrotica virgifera virgifera TaxID=50390 RepID=A0A6P7FNE7_DIAVI